MTLNDERILDCGHRPSTHGEHTTGTAHYGDKEICCDCAGEVDRKAMIESGRSRTLPLYLTSSTPGAGEVTNWPGSLRFKVIRSTHGSHNIGGKRTDVWFLGPDGFVWHGVQIGNWNTICHARRTKQRN